MKPGTVALLASRAFIAARDILDNDRRNGPNNSGPLLIANLSILGFCRHYAGSQPSSQQLHHHIETLINDLYWHIEECCSWNPDGLMRVIYCGR